MFLKSLRYVYDNFEEVFCALSVGTMVACLMIQVGVRWATGSGMAWTEELSRYSFLWTVFVGAALVAKHGTHVRITAQYLLMPLKVRLGFRMFTDLLWVCFNLYIAWLSWNVIQSNLLFPELSPVLGIVRAYVEMIIPFGFVLMSWRIVEGYIRRWLQGTLLQLVEQVQ
ncbi:TRAP transporter small permease [Desulfonatronum lacustre]|uniref:TRAP transporter small permease n=1 Tax=Desulfonatronum lacustre TaxID=66849 RepID=UPI00048BD157|nr:TRAP transporter small permease [Desulfonatronum lacustre]SMP45889.1 TRAP-type C4-dicarboxylate transport system, small permease component [Desulfonatronum zhilinae]